MRIRVSYFHTYPGDEMLGRPRYSKNSKCYELNAKENCEEVRVNPETVSSSAPTVTTVFTVTIVISTAYWCSYKLADKGEHCFETDDTPVERSHLE